MADPATSLWWQTANPIPTDSRSPASCGVLVAGAGLSGIATALLLARRGVDVTVVEARRVGAVTTGNTTGKVAGHLAGGWLSAETTTDPADPPAEGTGRVARRGLRPVAESTVDGEACALSAVCTHLGGIVQWNDAERTWDCPLHGSRFDHRGRLLEGPAVRDLDTV